MCRSRTVLQCQEKKPQPVYSIIRPDDKSANKPCGKTCHIHLLGWDCQNEYEDFIVSMLGCYIHSSLVIKIIPNYSLRSEFEVIRLQRVEIQSHRPLWKFNKIVKRHLFTEQPFLNVSVSILLSIWFTVTHCIRLLRAHSFG